MPAHDDGAAPPRPFRLSRRALLGALALAPALPWLAGAAPARGDDEGDSAFFPAQSTAAPMPRQMHTATPLGGGYVLLAGGLPERGAGQSALADVEILGPDGRLRAAAPLNTPRYGHAAVRLGGRVVVLGGFGQGPLADVEVYHPGRDTWTTLAPLSLPRSGHAAVRLSDDTVLVTGGVFESVLSETELYVL